jgi:hypothetical protein
MAVKVYGMDVSAPVRMVMMTCEVLEIEYELVVVNLMEGEHLKPDYIKVRIHTTSLWNIIKIFNRLVSYRQNNSGRFIKQCL